MVAAGTRRSRTDSGLDYSGTYDLFRARLHLAESRVDLAESIAGNGNRTRMASLEGWNFTIKLCPRPGELSWRAITQIPTYFFEVLAMVRRAGILFFECGRDKCCIVAAKTKRIVQHDTHFFFFCNIGRVIKVAFCPWIFQIDSGRNHGIPDGQRARGHFHSTGAA